MVQENHHYHHLSNVRDLYIRTVSNKKAKKGATLKSFTSYLAKHIVNIMEAYDILGANIALVKGGETAWNKACGYDDEYKC